VSFPRLLYVGDVPVEASYHGSALLHRLLTDYPADRLTVLETASHSQADRRLPNVNYLWHSIGNPRWLNTRFHPYAVAWFSQKGTRMGAKVSQSMNGFQVESVLTVAHGFGWLAAADIAAKRRVPLHLMVHDDWPRVATVPTSFRKRLDEHFARVYRQAQSRLCVSPSMSREYQKRYGKAADVIYPIRAQDCLEFDGPPERLARNDKPFTVAFAGTINSQGYIRALMVLQEALKSVGGRLLIFGPSTSVEFDTSTTEVCGLLKSSDLLMHLRSEADALFVPMSFDSSERTNMEMAFPSKLADYTATGLPLLIYGPGYCSAVAWARENPGVAETIDTEDQLSDAIQRLANDPAYRIALGKCALEVGRKYFTHERVKQVFYQALSV
jgi:glycosyltransferase involved in cell wall biosynthesis